MGGTARRLGCSCAHPCPGARVAVEPRADAIRRRSLARPRRQCRRGGRERCLPPVGGTVLDVGCGGGRASMALVPPANEVIGVDSSGAMLDRIYVAAANDRCRSANDSRSVARRRRRCAPGATSWCAITSPYNVADIVPFLWALTEHARLAVVAGDHRPCIRCRPGHRRGVTSGVSNAPLVRRRTTWWQSLREIGLDPEHTTSARRPAAADEADRARIWFRSRDAGCACRPNATANWPIGWRATLRRGPRRWPRSDGRAQLSRSNVTGGPAASQAEHVDCTDDRDPTSR